MRWAEKSHLQTIDKQMFLRVTLLLKGHEEFRPRSEPLERKKKSISKTKQAADEDPEREKSNSSVTHLL